jgi:hypothetical protein
LDKLKDFCDWYLSSPRQLIVPCERGVHFQDGLTATVIFRQGRFQVELVSCAPGMEIPDHVHPNVDSFEIYMGGGIMFRLNGELLIRKAHAMQKTWHGGHPLAGTRIRVKPDAPHGAAIGPEGGVFLSIQHWLDREPTTVGDDWRGDYLGPTHEKRLNGEKNGI